MRRRPPYAASKRPPGYILAVSRVLPDWPVREHAEALRQWPVIVELVERAGRLPGFTAFILIGSFAGGSPDELSDVDAIVSIEDASFDAAWDARTSLYASEPIVSWDFRPDPERRVATHYWFTRELILVECLLASPSGRPRLADPHVILAGDPSSTSSFRHVEPISRKELEAYVQRLRDEGHEPPDAQRHYNELVCALRAASTRRDATRP